MWRFSLARSLANMPSSLLDVARAAHNDDPWNEPKLHPVCVDGVQVGFLLPSVLTAARSFVSTHERSGLLAYDGKLVFADDCCDVDARTRAIGALAQWLRETGQFCDALDGAYGAGD